MNLLKHLVTLIAEEKSGVSSDDKEEKKAEGEEEITAKPEEEAPDAQDEPMDFTLGPSMASS